MVNEVKMICCMLLLLIVLPSCSELAPSVVETQLHDSSIILELPSSDTISQIADSMVIDSSVTPKPNERDDTSWRAGKLNPEPALLCEVDGISTYRANVHVKKDGNLQNWLLYFTFELPSDLKADSSISFIGDSFCLLFRNAFVLNDKTILSDYFGEEKGMNGLETEYLVEDSIETPFDQRGGLLRVRSEDWWDTGLEYDYIYFFWVAKDIVCSFEFTTTEYDPEVQRPIFERIVCSYESV